MSELRRVILRDTTMREGLDAPGVSLTLAQRADLLSKLDELGVPEVEIVAPGHFWDDLELIRKIDWEKLTIRPSALIYVYDPNFEDQVRASAGLLDRVDLLVPLASARPPFAMEEKRRRTREALRTALALRPRVGIGFPHALQVEEGLVQAICDEGAREGADRLMLYDTNGGADPFQVAELVAEVSRNVSIPVGFHSHNDLGMATANALAAVRSGATWLDVTVNGVGDRAGNASLEQVALALHLKGVEHGLRLPMLQKLCADVAEMTGIPVPKQAPVVGEFAFLHKSPSHLATPALFEAFDPKLVGGERDICKG